MSFLPQAPASGNQSCLLQDQSPFSREEALGQPVQENHSLQWAPGGGSSSTPLKETLWEGGLSVTIHSLGISAQCTQEQSPSILHFFLKDNCPHLGGRGEMKSHKHLPVRLHRYCCYFCGISTYHAQQQLKSVVSRISRQIFACCLCWYISTSHINSSN